MPSLRSPARARQATEEMVERYHRAGASPPPRRCGGVHVQNVAAPLPVVWSVVRRFDRPQAYKRFVRACALRAGDGGIGSVREVQLVSGLPAGTSTERLDALDDERHVISFSIVGGDHRLVNYSSTTTARAAEADGGRGCELGTVVVESYAVDVPPGSTEEETCLFAGTIIGCNLRSLANVAEEMARSDPDG